MSVWTHLLCQSCWEKREPGRTPIRVKDDPGGRCCGCGVQTTVATYVREDPQLMRCRGLHAG